MVTSRIILIAGIKGKTLKEKYQKVRKAVRSNLASVPPLDLDTILEDSKLEQEIGQFISGFTKYCHEKEEDCANQCMWWLEKYCSKYKQSKLYQELNKMYKSSFNKDYVREE